MSNSEGEEVSNGEGDDDDVECPVCHVRGLSCNGFVVTIAMYGTKHTALMQILIASQICFTV